MGQLFAKVSPEELRLAAPKHVQDQSKVGDVFLFHVDSLESPEVYGDKRAHWIIVIDVAGETSDDCLVYHPLVPLSFLTPFPDWPSPHTLQRMAIPPWCRSCLARG